MRTSRSVGVWGVAVLALATVALAKDGDLDPSFGGTGHVETNFNPGSIVFAGLSFGVLVQPPDQKIVVAGWVSDITDPADFAVARYNPDGSLDRSFGGTGLVRQGFGFLSFEEAFAVLRQPDGKLVLGGWRSATLGPGSADFALMRLLPNGTTDSGFGSGGKVSTNLGGDDWVLTLARQPDGKLLAAGRSGPLGKHDFGIVRYLPNGQQDMTFGVNGRVLTDFGGRDDAVFALGILADGKILAVGTSQTSVQGASFKIVMARYTPLGRLDTSFGTGGKVLMTIGTHCAAISLALLPGGKFLVGGGIALSGGPASSDLAVMRFTPAGKLDTTFGTGGRATVDFGHKFDTANGMRVLPNGKIVLAGAADESTVAAPDGGFGVARFTTAGKLDTTFGVGGKVKTQLGSRGSRATALALQKDGKIVVAGTVFTPSPAISALFGVARYLNTASPAQAAADAGLGADDTDGADAADDPDGSGDPDAPDGR